MIWRPLEIAAWEPPPDTPICEWIEQNVYLSGDAQEKGPYRFARVPFFRGIAEAFDDPAVKTIALMKPAQIGGTWGVYSILAYVVSQMPCRMLIVMADQDTAEKACRDRLQPVFQNSPVISHKVLVMTQRELSFATGAKIDMAWASSVAKLATFTCGVVALDEVDKDGYYAASREADPISLASERTKAFVGSKILILSTPTTETGNITREMESCDTVYDFHVPCPYCGQPQPLRWSPEYLYGFEGGQYVGTDGKIHRFGGVKWEGGRHATKDQIRAAGYECGECGKLWTTIQKNLAVEKGEWFPRGGKSNGLRKIGFHLNRLYSLIGEASQIDIMVSEWFAIMSTEESYERRKKLQGFINSTLAEPWQEVVIQATESEILKARCDLAPQTVPDSTLILTVGIDVQKYGFWFAVRAWAQDYTSWLIDYGYLGEWEDVDRLIFDTWYPTVTTHVNHAMSRAAIDTGGGEAEAGFMTRTEEVYWYVRQNGTGRGCRVYATKGSSHPLPSKVQVGKPLDKTPSGKPIPGGLQIYLIDTDQLKEIYHARIEAAIKGTPRAAYLNRDVGEDYARQVTAEVKERDPKKGTMSWVQKRADNHLLDTEVMAIALAEPDWPGGNLRLIRRQDATPEAVKRERREEVGKGFLPKRKGWLNR